MLDSIQSESLQFVIDSRKMHDQLKQQQENEYAENQNDNTRARHATPNIRRIQLQQMRFTLKVIKVRQKPYNHNKCCTNFTNCLWSINIISLIIFYLLWNYIREYPSEKFYDQFILNQSQGIIQDIIFLNTSTKCPSEYESLFNYEWPGTFIGCDCTQNLTSQQIVNNTEFIKNFQKEKQCDQLELDRGCKTLFEINGKTLTQLNDNNYSKPFVLCAKRSMNVSLRYNFTYCQLENKTVCGSGALTYCLPPEVECPISEIGFTTNFDYQNLKLKNDPKYGKIFNVSNKLQFYYTKNQSLIPISQVQMTETEDVCKLNSQNNISPNRQDYYLMKIQRNHCQQNDSQFKVIHRLNEDQFYLANNLLALNRSLPYFKTNSSIIWTLQTKAYTQIKESCQFASYDEISQYERFMQKIDLENVLASKFINSQLIILILLLILKIFPYNLNKFDVNQFRETVQGSVKLPLKIYFILILRLLIIVIHFSIVFLVFLDEGKLGSYKDNVTDFISSQCIVTELASSIYDFDQLDDSLELFVFKIFIIYAVQGLFLIYQIYKVYELYRLVLPQCRCLNKNFCLYLNRKHAKIQDEKFRKQGSLSENLNENEKLQGNENLNENEKLQGNENQYENVDADANADANANADAKANANEDQNARIEQSDHLVS